MAFRLLSIRVEGAQVQTDRICACWCPIRVYQRYTLKLMHLHSEPNFTSNSKTNLLDGTFFSE